MVSKKDNQKKVQKASACQWIRVVVMYLLIPLMLLVCGGDLGWQKAWIYALLIVASGIGGRIWVEQRHPGLMGERQNIENIKSAKTWDKVLAPLMALSLVFPMVIVAGLDHRFSWSPPFPLWLIVIGFILISVGYAYATWAFAENHFFSSVVRIQTDRELVVCDSGPYRIVRHPGYAGKLLPLLGIVLELGSVWNLFWQGRGGVDHSGDQNRTGRSDAAGRVTRLSGLCAACALSVDPGDLLRSLASALRFAGGVSAGLSPMPKSHLAIVPSQGHVSLMMQTKTILSYLKEFLN